jgi:hypothetical protein
VNYEKYRKIQTTEDRREYFRLHKQEQRAAKAAKSTPVHTESTLSTDVTDVDVEVEAKTKPCANASSSHGCGSPQTALESEAVTRVWDYYLEKFGKNSKLLSFTAARKQKGAARLRECLKKTGGNVEKAEELMRVALDALAASAFHRGENDRKRKYDSWEANAFKSQEQLEGWLERA